MPRIARMIVGEETTVYVRIENLKAALNILKTTS
jgi:hypothetical protein